jgi:hypothetical protein
MSLTRRRRCLAATSLVEAWPSEQGDRTQSRPARDSARDENPCPNRTRTDRSLGDSADPRPHRSLIRQYNNRVSYHEALAQLRLSLHQWRGLGEWTTVLDAPPTPLALSHALPAAHVGPKPGSANAMFLSERGLWARGIVALITAYAPGGAGKVIAENLSALHDEFDPLKFRKPIIRDRARICTWSSVGRAQGRGYSITRS